MATLKLKISLEPAEIEVEKDDYKEEWQERQEESGEVEVGEDAGEPSDAFVVEMVEEDFASGVRSYDDEFTNSKITVEIPL